MIQREPYSLLAERIALPVIQDLSSLQEVP
jgi:hypothetical protein